MADESLDELPTSTLVALIEEVRAAMAVAQTRIAELEAEVATLRTGGPPRKTATNSSLPPAKGWKARRADPPPGNERPKRGPRCAHAGVSRRRVPREAVDVVLPCRPSHCGGCGGLLPRTGGVVVARRQVTELPPGRPVVIDAQRLRVGCRCCGHGSVGCYPDGCGYRPQTWLGGLRAAASGRRAAATCHCPLHTRSALTLAT